MGLNLEINLLCPSTQGWHDMWSARLGWTWSPFPEHEQRRAVSAWLGLGGHQQSGQGVAGVMGVQQDSHGVPRRP